tara:strand:+ start:287 stop:652 length:366 start_codon:yes stop_codon:yes gene_type:complete
MEVPQLDPTQFVDVLRQMAELIHEEQEQHEAAEKTNRPTDPSWRIPTSDLLINFTDHLFYPECGMCYRQCENEWGNNGYPLTEKRICNQCNERVVHNRIMLVLDTVGPNAGLDDDCPENPQ